jgi:hypothetical protein
MGDNLASRPSATCPKFSRIFMQCLTKARFLCRKIAAKGRLTAVCRALATNSTLRRIDLGFLNERNREGDNHNSRNRLAQEDVKDIRFAVIHNSRLETLGLRAALCPDVDMSPFASALAHNKHLIHLDLSHNPLSDEGAQTLGEALAANCSLKYVNLEFMEATQDAYWSLCTGLASNRCLLVLRLGWMYGEDHEEAVGYLVEHNTKLQCLAIRRKQDEEEEDEDGPYHLGGMHCEYEFLIEAVALNTTLQSLTLGSVGRVTAFGIIGLLQENSTLRELDANCTRAYYDSYDDHSSRVLCGSPSPHLALALKDHPRYFLLGRMVFPTDSRHTVLRSLGLAEEQDASVIERRIHLWHLQKVMAFAMAQHSRLGQVSEAQQLGKDCADMAMMMYFGLPLDYVGQILRTPEYVDVLKAVPYWMQA